MLGLLTLLISAVSLELAVNDPHSPAIPYLSCIAIVLLLATTIKRDE